MLSLYVPAGYHPGASLHVSSGHLVGLLEAPVFRCFYHVHFTHMDMGSLLTVWFSNIISTLGLCFISVFCSTEILMLSVLSSAIFFFSG